MEIQGIVKRDRVTKNLTKRLEIGDIALISHRDLDEVAALNLVEKGVIAVINTDETISGKYPNLGPEVLVEANIPIFEVKGLESVENIKENDNISIINQKIYIEEDFICDCKKLSDEDVHNLLNKSMKNIGVELDRFIENTLEYAKKEKALVTGEIHIPKIKTNMKKKHVLIVVRGRYYKRDLEAIENYINEVKPVLIGVDGGADALLEFGYTPDIIIGDMDSVSDKALLTAKEIIVHAFLNGKAPGLERVESLGIEPVIFSSIGTSEDITLLLAYENQADIIVAVGTHNNMIDFLEKGRPGMASTFLTRLKVGDKLVDARGVNKLYSSGFNLKYLVIIILASFLPILTLIIINPVTRGLLQLILINIRLFFNI